MSTGRESTKRPRVGDGGGGTQPAWQVVGVSVRGSSHEERDQPCQDANWWRTLLTGGLIAAVADGAGSASLGQVGAELAAKTAVNALAESGIDESLESVLDDELTRQKLVTAMETAKVALAAEAECRAVELGELATTLILLLATADGIVAAQIGDGAAVVGDRDGNVVGVTQPQNGEYINETTFLTSDEALDEVQIGVWQGTPKQGAIFSDGIQMLCLKIPEGVPHSPFFVPLFEFVSEIESESVQCDSVTGHTQDTGLKRAEDQLRTFLNSARVSSNSTDDRTLLLFSFIGEQASVGGPTPEQD